MHAGAAHQLEDAVNDGKPNEFSRSMASSVCTVCGWKALEHPGYDADFHANYVAIHFAKKHPGDLPYGLIEGVAEYLRSTARFV